MINNNIIRVNQSKQKGIWHAIIIDKVNLNMIQ